MAELKTKKTEASVENFLASVTDEARREDAIAVCALMQQVTKEKPKMWGSTIIGFGSRKLVYESGRELDWMLVGFSPRKANTVLYLSLAGYAQHGELMAKLGKHKTGKGCLYINKLADIDLKVLKDLVKRAVQYAKK